MLYLFVFILLGDVVSRNCRAWVWAMSRTLPLSIAGLLSTGLESVGGSSVRYEPISALGVFGAIIVACRFACASALTLPGGVM